MLGVRHGFGGVVNNEYIPAVGFGLSWVEVGGFAHVQAGKVTDFATASGGYGDGQGADGVGLVDDYEYAAVGLHGCENVAQRCFVLGNGLP